MNTSPSTSKGTVKAPTLGKCPECKMLFQKAKFALQCCICKRNYHSQCLNINSQGDRTSEMIAGIKSVEKNLICTNCETAAQTAIAEQQMLQDQLGQMQSKLRSHEQDTERLRHEQQRQLDAMRQTCQGVLTEDHQKMVDDFNKLKEEHERAKQEMEEKEIAQAARFQMALTEATTEINPLCLESRYNKIRRWKPPLHNYVPKTEYYLICDSRRTLQWKLTFHETIANTEKSAKSASNVSMKSWLNTSED